MENSTLNPSLLSSAMALFDAGEYDEVLTLASGTNDPALMLLAARSYLATGKYDIAETLLRSLIRIMPGSSYLHSYLGDVLLKSGKEGAVDEFATALILDPDNKGAVKNYAYLQVKAGDYRGAIPSLRSLIWSEDSEEEIKLLEKILTQVGEPKESVNVHIHHFGEECYSIPYIETLLAAGEYQKCLNLSLKGWNETEDTAYLRLDLEALAAINREAAEKAYRSALDTFEDGGMDDENIRSIRFSYVLLEKVLGHYEMAKEELSHLLSPDSPVEYLLVAADLETKLGNGEGADLIYRKLLVSTLSKQDVDWDTAELIINHFIGFLSAVRTKEEVAGVISVTLSPYPIAVCLAKIGAAYEEANSASQAKDWFYRAYRADYLNGGLAYAGYLKRAGEFRDAETVIRYIFNNTIKLSDIEQAANNVLNGSAGLYRIDKCREIVQKKLAANADKLTTAGREMLSSMYLYSAVEALEQRNFEECKWFCLSGIDVLPCYPAKIHIQDFTDILVQAKGRSLYERPVLRPEVVSSESSNSEEILPIDAGEDDLFPNLDERERKILSFLREHKEATEMDLRSILDTHRITGIVNSLIEKTTEFGVTLIEKRGVGDRGEVYGYVGRQ
ncbi:MAG TPA: hypothetical protein O0W79_04495 [Methanocorpusculum sp.]|nr:hypothetical protein [Methanocorpusculum sp.]